MTSSFDVVIVGSGFAGSLLAAMLRQRGQRVALVEQGQHPRFAIGESSTPLADFKLKEIAREYGLKSLEPLTTYGHWLQEYPKVMRGPKRGFSYFYHRPGEPFTTDAQHRTELLVAANSSLELADTHWLRSDADLLFLEQAIAAGVEYFDQSFLESFYHHDRCELRLRRNEQSITLSSDFIVIATGNPQVWQNGLSIPFSGHVPRTRSRTLFAHLKGVQPWQTVLEKHGHATHEHPFPCDQSALHHVFDRGWMWQLRFDNQVTSVGWMLDCDQYPLDPQVSAQQEWDTLCRRFPTIAEQLSGTQLVAPENGVRRVSQLQSELRMPSGPCWALLPAAVGFADPLYSTGIAHALTCVQRLGVALQTKHRSRERSLQLQEYQTQVMREIDLIDRLISLAYRTSSQFESYVAMTMLYFAASTASEIASKSHSQDASRHPSNDSFLFADNPRFLSIVDQVESRVHMATVDGQWDRVAEDVERWLQPFNHVGLFHPEQARMYRYTSAK